METVAIRVIISLSILQLCTSTNLIINGGFEVPAVPNGSDILEGLMGWNGSTYQIMNKYRKLGHGQYIDLQGLFGLNGYIEQNVVLTTNCSCNLSFLQQAYNTSYDSFVMQVLWNEQLISTQYLNTTDTTFHSFTVAGVPGNNLLKFKQIGFSDDNPGTYIDEVSLVCQFDQQDPPAPQIEVEIAAQIKIIAGVLFSTFFNQASGIRALYLFAQDMWLYNYDKRKHEGSLYLLLNTTAMIESLKFSVFDKIFGWGELSKNMPISDYLPYTNQRFVKIEGSSSVLIKAAFPFFIYTIPTNIALCTILYFLYLLLRPCRISQVLRRFYFIKTVLLQTLLEGNVIYFVYVCLGHLTNAFHFQLGDKLSLAFTVLFLWIVFVFTFTFYPLVGYYLKKDANKFTQYVFQSNPGYLFISSKNLVRNFLRGAIFYFLHYLYLQQLILLSVVELLLLAIMSLRFVKQAFTSRYLYFFWLFYHFLFILLNSNLSFLYVCYTVYQSQDLKSTSLFLQKIIVYLLISMTGLIALLDLIPFKSIMKSKCIRSLLSSKNRIQDIAETDPQQQKIKKLSNESLRIPTELIKNQVQNSSIVEPPSPNNQGNSQGAQEALDKKQDKKEAQADSKIKIKVNIKIKRVKFNSHANANAKQLIVKMDSDCPSVASEEIDTECVKFQ